MAYSFGLKYSNYHSYIKSYNLVENNIKYLLYLRINIWTLSAAKVIKCLLNVLIYSCFKKVVLKAPK